jgi:dimethylhistidine N-methyltransferase
MLLKDLNALSNHKNLLDIEGNDIIQGLSNTPKSLPPKYFYNDRGSELFEQICALPEYYPTRTESLILLQCAQEIAQITGECELIELGSGSSTKTHFLLDAYYKISDFGRYVPIDVSKGILESTVLQLQQKYSSFSIQGLLGTYEQALTFLATISSTKRMIFFLGSSIGNFNSQESNVFLSQISHTLNAGDYFLLGIDLQKPTEILEAAYNDSQGVTAAFNLNILAHLNWRFQGDFNLDFFSHQAVYNQKDNQIEMYLNCHKNHQVSLDKLNLEIELADGESILTEISRKFDIETMKKQLASHGLAPLKAWTDPRRWFGLILCQA